MDGRGAMGGLVGMKRMPWLAAILHLTLAGSAFADDAPIWTDRPVRIDRSKQDYERLPTLTLGLEGGTNVSFPVRLDMHDSGSFSANGVEYVLRDIKPIADDRICKTQAGARWPCGRQASVFVSNLFRARTVICKVEQLSDKVALSGCRTTRKRIPYEIISRGMAFPATDNSELAAALLQAKAQRAGIWRDAACATALHSC